MVARLKMYWVAVRDSLWFLPGLMTLIGAALAMILTRAELTGLIQIGYGESWLFSGGAEGARGVLSAIAGGLITVTGVVFSVTIVALQLASSQFTPRVLRGYTADRSNQLVLGVFIGTFTYTLLVLRTVRSGGDDDPSFVPRLAVAIAVVLVLVSIGFLIFFINHSARSVQVSYILDNVTKRTLRDVERVFSDRVSEQSPGEEEKAWQPLEGGRAVTASRCGYLQAVDADAMVKLADEKDAIVAMEPGIGGYVFEGRPLAFVSPPDAVDDELIRRVRKAIVIGSERTPEQDVEFGIIEMCDIAVKALSPGINDPTTAFHCIDHLATVIAELGRRRVPGEFVGTGRKTRFIPRYTTFERAVELAFDQIWHFGKENPAVVKKLRDTLGELAEMVPPPRDRCLRSRYIMLDAATLPAIRSV